MRTQIYIMKDFNKTKRLADSFFSPSSSQAH